MAACGQKDARCHKESGVTCCGGLECDWAYQGGKRCVEPRQQVGHSLEGRPNIHDRAAAEAKAKASAAKASAAAKPAARPTKP